MKKSEREEMKRKIDAIRIPHEWWTESISQAIPVVLYRAGDNEWPVLVTQEIPKHITPDDCDKFTFGNEQRARVAEFAGAANPAAIQSMLAYVDRLEAQRDRLQEVCGQWEEKAKAWFTSPEAAQQLAGYRDLAQRMNESDAALLVERARLDFVLTKAIALYHGQLTWTDGNLRTHFVACESGDARECIDLLMIEQFRADAVTEAESEQ